MRTKVLTVCIGGTVRSVGIKDILNGSFGCDALAASHFWQSHGTMAMLCTWADLIIPVEPRDLPKGPDQYRESWRDCIMWNPEYDHKIRVMDLGPDVWGNARNPELSKLIHSKLANFGPLE